MIVRQTACEWIAKAAAYELLAKSFTYPNSDLAQAIIDGEYGRIARNLIVAFETAKGDELKDLLQKSEASFEDTDVGDALERLRVEHTRLFIGTRQPLVSPYGSYWKAVQEGREPVLFLGRETSEVEAVMHAAGVGNKPGLKEPLDNISCELEFLQYACLVLGGVESLRDGAQLSAEVVEHFIVNHLRNWTGDFAGAVEDGTADAFYLFAARLLVAVG